MRIGRLILVSALIVCIAAAASGQQGLKTGELTAERDIDPPSYKPDQKLNHLYIGIDFTGASADNRTDKIYYKFPDFVRLDPNNIQTNLSDVSEPRLIDPDNDRVKEVIVLSMNKNGSGRYAGRVILDTAADFEGYGDFHINSTVADSKYGNETTVGDFLFEGNAEYYIHNQKENHSHQNDFKDSLRGCPEGHFCPAIPEAGYLIEQVVELLSF